jgi:hypothetical protein
MIRDEVEGFYADRNAGFYVLYGFAYSMLATHRKEQKENEDG